MSKMFVNGNWEIKYLSIHDIGLPLSVMPIHYMQKSLPHCYFGNAIFLFHNVSSLASSIK